MRIFIAALCLFTALASSAQCEDGRFRNFVFTDYDFEADVLYGNNIDYEGNDTDLYLDIYSPSGDTEVDRPLVIVSHGGSFVGGSKDGDDVVPICQDLAKMGYVVASIQYRIGIPILGPISQNAKKAVIRGAQDSKAAVRFFRKDVAENGNSYNIDPDKIYMLGVSAGGFNALNVAYLREDEEIPSDIDLSGDGLGGGAEGLSGNAGYSSHIAGVVNVAGAIAELDMMDEDEPPVASFHGTGDGVVPFGSEVLSFLTVFEVDTVHGSESIHARAEELGLVNCFQVQWQEGHVPHVSNAQHYDTLRSVTSNFLSHLVCPDVELDCDYRSLEVISSIDEWTEAEVDIWPNPASSHLSISSGADASVSYQIIDMTGQVALSLSASQNPQQSIDISALSEGLYFIRLVQAEQEVTKKFIIQR